MENLARYAVVRTELRGYYMRFEDWVKRYDSERYDGVACGVDNPAAIIAVARYGIERRTRVVFANISADAEAARIFIQRPDAACFACYRPQTLDPSAEDWKPCLPIPAVADILHVAVGFAARALIGEILEVPIGDYNCRDISFSGIDFNKTVSKQPNCLLCGTGSREIVTWHSNRL